MTATADGLAASVPARRDGFIAIDAARGDADDRRLIALTVTPDASPVVRITTPGKDLLFADGTATIKYRGAQWTVIQRAGNAPVPGSYRVAELVGNRLLVEKA